MAYIRLVIGLRCLSSRCLIMQVTLEVILCGICGPRHRSRSRPQFHGIRYCYV